MSWLAELDASTALNNQGGATGWVHLLPVGPFTGRDGRSFVNDQPESVIAAFRERAIDLPIDYEHQNDRPESRLSDPVPAAGWVKDVELRPNGVWGLTEWTSKAREMIANREYRFVSPTFLFRRDNKRVTRLKGAGLVHSPNLHLTALSAENDTMPEHELIAQIAEALGLPADAKTDDVMAFIRRFRELLAKVSADADSPAQMCDLIQSDLTPDPAKFVPIATVQAMLSERNTTLATMTEERAEAKIKDAMSRGYLSPAMRGWALALCKSDEASFDEFLGKSIPHFAGIVGATKSSTSAAPPPPHLLGFSASPERSAQELAICEQLGLDPATF